MEMKMKMAKQKSLAEEVAKFVSYVDAHMSRSFKVQEALGKTGAKMLARLAEMADADLGNEVAPQSCDPTSGVTDPARKTSSELDRALAVLLKDVE